MYKIVEVLGYKVFNEKLSDINFERKLLINTFSPNSYGLASKDKKFEKALKNTDVLLLDGIGISLGSLLINGKCLKKIAGQDCFDYLMDQANRYSWKVFFLGSTQKTLFKITIRAQKEFPNIIVSSYSPPYKPEFFDDDNTKMIQAINSFKPDILFIGMTAPKQEKWAFEHKEKVNAQIISTIGNVFDWYAGNSKRPSKLWISLGLEWLARIIIRPEILKRNTGNQLLFLRDLLLHISFIKRIGGKL